jgi:dTDP-4-dehydrorhamnose reductase
VLGALPDAVILRTSWVYAEHGKNFVRTMLEAARRRDRLTVVADQRGCPTNADDLADAVLAVADRMRQPGARYGGIYHAAGGGETTWHGFARAIFAAAGPLGWKVPQVDAIATADWPTPARRPADSRLDCGKLAAIFGVRLPDWQPSLVRAVRAICATETVA